MSFSKLKRLLATLVTLAVAVPAAATPSDIDDLRGLERVQFHLTQRGDTASLGIKPAVWYRAFQQKVRVLGIPATAGRQADTATLEIEVKVTPAISYGTPHPKDIVGFWMELRKPAKSVENPIHWKYFAVEGMPCAPETALATTLRLMDTFVADFRRANGRPVKSAR